MTTHPSDDSRTSEQAAARRPSVEDVLDEAIGALRLAEVAVRFVANDDGEYIIPVEATTVLGRVISDAADRLATLHHALPSRLMNTAVEDVAADSGADGRPGEASGDQDEGGAT